jgi:hypothetical protein
VGYSEGVRSNKRKAAIGYATYVAAGRVARKVVRRRARRPMRERVTDAMRPRRRQLPLVGGAAAAVAGAAVIAVHRRRNGSHEHD